MAYHSYEITVESSNGVDYDLLNVKISLICFGTADVSPRRNRHYYSGYNSISCKSSIDLWKFVACGLRSFIYHLTGFYVRKMLSLGSGA